MQINSIWVTEEEYSFKAKDISSGNDTTQIEIVRNNYVPLIPPTAQGNTDEISKLVNVTSGARCSEKLHLQSYLEMI